MKKIGLVTTWFERGAAYVSKQFKEVWEEENQVYIYARGGEKVAKHDPNWQYDKITYGKRFNYTKLDIIDLKHFENWIKTNDLDIVFFNEQHLWKPVLLCKKLGVITGSYIDYYTEKTIDFFNIYDFLICNTKRHYSIFKDHPQCFYVPWGTDTKIYNEKQQKKTQDNQVVFFHSAGMNPYRKGTDYVIKAFSKSNFKTSKLIIHTQIDLLLFFPELKQLIKKLIFSDKLEIINKTITAPGLYHTGDVYVYPSRLEGIGLSLVEALCCGMPAITTNEAPMNEFVNENINGKLINVRDQQPRKDGYYWKESYVDVDHLTEIMNSYSIYPETLHNKKQKTLEYSLKNFNWKENSKILLSIVKNLKPNPANKDLLITIRSFEKSRGLKFYITNLVIYDKLKKLIKKFK
ncbi:glycosyltransferase [uncultured Tenacibaculum sp.]|uniref:glycosyltransferase family 4 protein n=1 Tax=uncultured Tenacibaculum sp. TaxID=174713 RepID=UPI002602345D|nr:glycosyltransferase [uncultured Tenacibaculum sp.]